MYQSVVKGPDVRSNPVPIRAASGGRGPRESALLQVATALNARPTVARMQALSRNLNARSERGIVQRQPHPSFDPASYAGATTTAVHPLFGAFRALGLPNSDVLRLSLGLTGVPDSNLDDEATQNQAHHIVESNDANAQPARTWLARAGIDLDSAVNGVLLPVAQADDTGDATVHVGSHVRGYAVEVNQQIRNAINAAGLSATHLLTNPCPPAQVPALRAAIVGILGQIRDFLLTHSLGINKGHRVDPDWTPDSKDRDKPDRRGGPEGGMSVKASFRQQFG